MHYPHTFINAGHVTDANGRFDVEWSVSADEGAFTNTSGKGTIIFPDYVYEGPPGEHTNDISWDESIWRRANNADMRWEITTCMQSPARM